MMSINVKTSVINLELPIKNKKSDNKEQNQNKMFRVLNFSAHF